MLKVWLKSFAFKGIENLSKIYDIAGVVAGVYDDNGHL